MTPAAQITALLAQRPGHPTWQKVCAVLDRTPPAELEAPLAAVEAGLASWPDDLNEGNLWPLPPRQASGPWARWIAKGKDAPHAWSIITFLQLHDHKFGKPGSAPLFANPALATLTHLYLAQCGLGDVGLQQLLDSPHTGALTHLVLSGNGMGEGSAAKLLPHTLGQQLHMLDIGSNQLGASDLEALLTTPMPNLRSLDFSYAGVPRDQLERLLHADTLPAITTLSVGAFDNDVNRELARMAGGHEHIKRALWRGWLLQRDTRVLRATTVIYQLPLFLKSTRTALIDALHKLDP